MACLSDYTLKGISLDCNANLAGIKVAYLGYKDDFTFATTEGTHKCTISGTSGAKLYQYDFAKQSGSLTSTLTKDEANGTRYYTNELSLSFNKMEGAKHIEIEAMAAEALVGIVGDNNGKYWVLGVDSYLSSNSATAQAGQSYSDKNGYDITLSSMSAHLPFEIEKADFESFISK